MVRSIYPESQNSQFGMTSEMSQKSETDTSTVDISIVSIVNPKRNSLYTKAQKRRT